MPGSPVADAPAPMPDSRTDHPTEIAAWRKTYILANGSLGIGHDATDVTAADVRLDDDAPLSVSRLIWLGPSMTRISATLARGTNCPLGVGTCTWLSKDMSAR
ncbi:hypothetical protein GCM10020258_52600 [Sphingomonas yabuuchiae]